jgi:aryl-alcohol dehydrogenase-like predicted oxidoreductase
MSRRDKIPVNWSVHGACVPLGTQYACNRFRTCLRLGRPDGTIALLSPNFQYINIRQEAHTPVDLAAFRQKGRDMLDMAYREGIRYFDTAPGYGLAEKLVLDWAHQKQDPTIEIATKWGYTYTANFDPNADVHEVKEHSLSKLNEQWATSKQLLPYLTTYQIHSATFETGVLNNKDILARLAELKQQHHLKIGLTTTGANQADVLDYAASIVLDRAPLFDVFQVTYNMLDQSVGRSWLRQLRQEGRRVVVKEALANGRLFPNANYPHYGRLYTILEELAESYHVGVDAIALRYVVDALQPFCVLSGAARADHLAGNLQTHAFQLTDAEIAALQSCAVPPRAYWAERKKLSWG